MTGTRPGITLLAGLRVLEAGPALAGAVCGALLRGLGASVTRLGPPPGGETPPDVATSLARGKASVSDASRAENEQLADLARGADVIVLAGDRTAIRTSGLEPTAIRTAHPGAVVVCVTPFGLSGPRSDWKATDLTTFFESGLARLLVGQVEDPASEAPVRAFGQQSEYVAGATAACAAALAAVRQARTGEGALIDVSMQEALAFVASRDLARPEFGTQRRSRQRTGDGNGATVCIVPASDGYVAISPREEHQWKRWLEVMGAPAWGGDARFARHADRAANWDALYPLMCDWSRSRPKREITAAAQDAHVPAFPLLEPAEILAEPQLLHRAFFQPSTDGSRRLPAPPFRITTGPGEARPLPAATDPTLPLAGLRVLDFSWVIAGPTCTRFLAAMGADVVKLESPGRGDPGRTSELHAVLGQGKRAITLDLKAPGGLDAAQALVAASDVVVENFAPGVLARLGLDAGTVFELSPGIVMLSASGLGQEGPGAGAVAYGTVLQCYSGFAALNGHLGVAPRVGMAWLDPLCALLMTTSVAAALRHRLRTGGGTQIDFAMLEGLLWTMQEALLAAQDGGPGPAARGNASPAFAPHVAVPCGDDDGWLAVAVTSNEEWLALTTVVPGLDAALDVAGRRASAPSVEAAIAAWAAGRGSREAAAELQAAGVPAGACVDSAELLTDPHLEARGFYASTEAPDGRAVRLPRLPWTWDGPVVSGRAPLPGEHTREILAGAAGLADEAIDAPADTSAFDRRQ